VTAACIRVWSGSAVSWEIPRELDALSEPNGQMVMLPTTQGEESPPP